LNKKDKKERKKVKRTVCHRRNCLKRVTSGYWKSYLRKNAFDEHCLLPTYVTTLRQRWRRRVAIEELFETNSRRDIENRRCHQEKLWRCWKMQIQKVHRI